MSDSSFPNATAADHVHTLTRAGIASIPLVGNAAVELFQAVVVPPVQKRQREWIESLNDRLRSLEREKRLRIDDLSNNEAFLDAVVQTFQAASKTSEQEKREALRNAVLNAALPHAPDKSRQQMFIHWADMLTVWHLRMLSLFANPLEWFKRQNRQPPQYHITSSLSGMLVTAFPELKDQRGLYDKVAKDLYNDGLMGTDSLHTMMSASGAFEMRATELGNQFLKFISEPSA